MSHTPVILLSLATILAAAPAAAFHDDTTPLIASTDLAGAGWVRYDLASDGAKVVVDLTADLASVPATAALLVSSSLGAFMLTLVLSEGGTEVHVSSDALPEGVSIDTTPDTTSGWTGAGLTLEGWTGPMTAVAWGAGGVSGIHAQLRGDPGVTLASASSGSRTFMLSPEDFEGAINARVTSGLVNPGVVSGAASTDVAGTVVGQYFAIGETNLVGVTTQQTSVTTPSGTTTCGCFWMDPNAAADPGTWTFSLTYAGATFVSNVFLTGADLSG